MLVVSELISIPDEEFQLDFARSGGPGGQNVNKVASKAILRWSPTTSPSLPEDVRIRLLQRVRSRLTTEGELIVTSQRTRDQSRNINDCREKLRQMVLAAARPPTPRRPTRPTLASKNRRLEAKSRRKQTKRLRQAPSDE